MAIKPIEKINVGEQVYDQLKQLLISGEWQAGSKIPSENELAQMFQVSRITVRQALQKLNALGLLETRLGEGSFVKTPDVGDSMTALIPTMYLGEQTNVQVFEFRQIIEVGCVRLAVKRATKRDVEQLKALQKRLLDCKNRLDLKGFSEVDLDFHFQIAKISRNDLIIKTNAILRDVLEHSMRQVIDKMGCENALYYHEQLIAAIEEKDETKAVEMMREHIQKNFAYFE